MATIQGVYVALFGRPADPAGLAFFNNATGNGANLSAIGDLAATKEYTDRFAGLSSNAIVNSIYQSLFNRDAEPGGLAFFVDALTRGTLTINNIAIAILDGALGNDKTIVDAKIASANALHGSAGSASRDRRLQRQCRRQPRPHVPRRCHDDRQDGGAGRQHRRPCRELGRSGQDGYRPDSVHGYRGHGRDQRRLPDDRSQRHDHDDRGELGPFGGYHRCRLRHRYVQHHGCCRGATVQPDKLKNVEVINVSGRWCFSRLRSTVANAKELTQVWNIASTKALCGQWHRAVRHVWA